MTIKPKWNPNNKFCVARVHYSVDPDKNTKEWIDNARRGTSEKSWLREYEISYEVFDGKPVFDEFGESHVQQFEWSIEETEYVYRGWDFGYHHPACVYAFMNKKGQMCWRYSILGEDEYIKEFATRMLLFSQVNFPNAKFLDACDDAGKMKKDTPDTSIEVMNSLGIYPNYRHSFINTGIEIMRQRLKMRNDGQYGMIFHPDASVLIDGMKGGYRYAERKEGSPEKEEPLKDGFFDHVMDASRELCINYLEVAPTYGMDRELGSDNSMMRGSDGLGMSEYF